MEEKKITINNLSINYKAFNLGARPNTADVETASDIKAGNYKQILVLHGWGVGSRSWVEAGESLAKNGFRVICPDLPGFGQSREPENAWNFDEYIRFVEQFVREMKFDKFHLVGHSFGGALACKFAALHPEIVEKLVLCDAAIIRKERLDWRQQYAKKMSAWKNRFLELPFAGGIYPLAKKLLYKLAGSHDYELASPTMREIFKKLVKTDTLEYAKKISLPTLIIWGEKDAATPVEDAHELHSFLINSKLIIIPGAGHKLHRTHARELARAIVSFLNPKQ